MMQREFEFAYYDFADQHISHYAGGILLIWNQLAN